MADGEKGWKLHRVCERRVHVIQEISDSTDEYAEHQRSFGRFEDERK